MITYIQKTAYTLSSLWSRYWTADVERKLLKKLRETIDG